MYSQSSKLECLCANCGRQFLAYPSDVKRGRGKYCSRICWADPSHYFWSKVEQGTQEQCWNWLGAVSRYGYGVFSLQGKSIGAHCFAYELLIDGIPDGYDVHHRCNNRLCVNPDHLEALSRRDHIHRGDSPSARNARKTQCPLGHPYDATNTIWKRRTNGQRFRVCRICDNSAQRHRWASGKKRPSVP